MDAPVLDEQALAMHMQPLRDDVVTEVIRLWIGHISEQADAIGAAVRAGDTVELGIAAHTLQGSATYVGATRLTDRCQQIVLDVNAHRVASAMSAGGRLAQEAAAAIAALRISKVAQRRHG